MPASADVTKRIASLEAHLGAENPRLAGLVAPYREMDAVLRRLRLMGSDETLTSRISWWPVVSFLGMFSAGKSTAINDLVGEPVQRTSRQAQDDKFTVLCYGPRPADLPGTALSEDSRFPFYGMSDEIEKVAPGEGKQVNSFLALKTVPSETLRGLIVVDSPGFDSDDYRSARLRLADHILDLSDLVVVFFDANRPEPGAMRDTLGLLVSKTQKRADADKFVYVLNQIDTVARENNLEEVVAAWQRAVATSGLTSGRFLTVYSENSRTAIDDPVVEARLKEIRDRDMGELRGRIAGLRDNRGYRIANGLRAVEKDLAEIAMPALYEAVGRWRSRTNKATVGAAVLALAAAVGLGALAGDPTMPLSAALSAPDVAAAVLAAALAGVHWKIGRFLAAREAAALPEKAGDFDLRVRAAFQAASRWPAVLVRRPCGWGRGVTEALARVRAAVSEHVREANDVYAAPSAVAADVPAAPAAAAAKA